MLGPVSEILVNGFAAAVYGVAMVGGGAAFAALLARAASVPRDQAGFVDSATAFSIGFGLYASAWILLGVGGWLRLPVVAALLFLGFVGGVRNLWREWRGRAGPARPNGAGPFARTDYLLTAALVILVAAFGLATFRLPFGDSVAVYMAWPKVIASSGLIAPLPMYETTSALWMTAEAHYAALMLLFGAVSAKCFIWIGFLAALQGAGLIASECGCGRRGRLLAALMVATSTAVVGVAVDGKTDLFAVAPALAAALLALRLTPNAPLGYAPVLIGLLAGTAVGVKLTYLVPLTASMVTLVAAAATVPGSTGYDRLLTFGKWCLVIGLAAVVISLPHLVKNAVLFAKPLYPLVGMDFGELMTWYSPGVIRRLLLTLPVALTFGEYWVQHGGISPLVLGFFPLLVVYGRGPDVNAHLVTRVALAAILGIAAWFAVHPSQLATRYFLASLLLLVVPAAWVGERAWQRGPKSLGRIVVAFAFVIALITTREVWLFHDKLAWSYLTERAEKGDRACVKQPYCELALRINEVVAPGERLLFRSYYRYYLRPDILQCIVSDVEFRGAGYNAPTLRALGTRYILVDRYQYHKEALPAGLTLDTVFEEPLFTLYEVKDGPAEGAARCVEEQPGRWRVIKPAT